MAIFKPGRLRRTLDPIIGAMWAFAMYSLPTDGLYEDVIQSVTIRRGKSERGGGSHPSTMEISLAGRYTTQASGHNVRFFLRDPAAVLLAAHLGASSTAIAPRFTGRLGASSVEDTGKKFSTTFSASSWIAQMNYSTASYTPTADTPVLSVIAGLSQAQEPLRGIDMYLFGASDYVAVDGEPTLFSDGIGKYAADIGILMQETRDGKTNVFGHLWRIANAVAKVSTDIPLTRSQAISPAQWEQQNERPPAIINYKITNSSNGPAVRTVDIPSPTGELREVVDLDWSHVKLIDADNQLYREAYALAYESNDRQYRVPSVTIDLLYLISSPFSYHRQQAAQLLTMEAGDPVYFSGDWPAPLLGIHFAEGITEQIDYNNWTIELSLVPMNHAVGYMHTTPIPARVWESATYPWNNETRKWDES